LLVDSSHSLSLLFLAYNPNAIFFLLPLLPSFLGFAESNWRINDRRNVLGSSPPTLVEAIGLAADHNFVVDGWKLIDALEKDPDLRYEVIRLLRFVKRYVFIRPMRNEHIN
jgi:hypothetical protein